MNKNINAIKLLGYELYKENWKQSLSSGEIRETLIEFYNNIDEPISTREQYESELEKYIYDVGYLGRLYVDFEEFLQAEYQNKSFMKSLYDNAELISEYEWDLAQYPDLTFLEGQRFDSLQDIEAAIQKGTGFFATVIESESETEEDEDPMLDFELYTSKSDKEDKFRGGYDSEIHEMNYIKDKSGRYYITRCDV